MNIQKTHRAWAMYDWANSAYNLVITSTIFPAYYTAITTLKKDNIIISDKVLFFGKSITNSVLFDYTLAAAYLILVFISPILSSIADTKGNKKKFMQLFCYIGSFACCGLYFFDKNNIEWGIILFGIAAIGFCGSLVFYNAFLPEIAEAEEQDALSAKGFAYGYVGSVLLQIICFVFVLKPNWFGITDESFPARLSFLLVGIWWMGFAQIPFRFLKDRPVESKPKGSIFKKGFFELKAVFNLVKKMPVMLQFLGAFFFYSMGVQTVMLAATIFGSKELHLKTEELIAVVLVIQLVAILGAVIMSKLSSIYGNIKVLFYVVIIWIVICLIAYKVSNAYEFYGLAALVGLVMGGIQSLSRSTYSKLIPLNTKDTASFFSFYDVTEKLAITVGMLSFGFIENITGSMRNSILALIVFFIIGAILLYYSNITEKK